jgi:hypothetical protein
MGNTPNVAGMVADPDFQGLAPADKRAALGKLTGDKSFAGLNDGETMQFVSRFQKPAQAQPAQTPFAPYSQITGMSAQPAPTGIRDKISTWSQNVMNDIKYGTDVTGVGSVLKKMGAHGVYSGEPEAVGDYMASLPLGLLRATKGGAEITQAGKTWQGTKDVVGGGLQAAQIPASFMGGEGVSAAASKIPSAERAGAAMNAVKAAVGSHTIDVGEVGNTALRAKQIAEAGGRMPKVINDFLRRATDPAKPPITYEEARDFYTNATKIASGEYTQFSGPMKAQVAEFTRKLGSALNEVAERAGRGEQLQQAMNEYSNAMKMKGAAQTAKDIVMKKILPSGAVGAGIAGGEMLVKQVFGGKK